MFIEAFISLSRVALYASRLYIYFGIFIVFSLLTKNERIPIKVSKYLKVPYAYNSLDLLRMRYAPYKSAHDGLYYVKAYDWRTYFYCKNDLITYDRKSNYEVTIFKYDFLNGSYKAVKLSKLEGIIKDEHVFFISINDQIRFAVSRDTELKDRKSYVTVHNVSNGRFLLKVNKEKKYIQNFCRSFVL
jgi:hypothetical protein